MVSRLLFLWLCAALPWSLQAAEIRIEPSHLMMGEPVKMFLKSDHLQALKQTFDWREIEEQFAVAVVSESQTVLRLHLYPYAAGTLQLSEQKFANFHLPETHLHVRANPEVQIEWQAPGKWIYEGQNALWSAKVTLHNPAYRAEFSNYEGGLQFVNPREIALNLPKQNFLVGSDTSATFRSGYRWAPDLHSGQRETVSLFSPQISVSHQTIRPWKFFDRPVKISVRPLPNFLPPSVWIGDLQWQQKPLPAVASTGDLLYFQWRLSSRQIDPEALRQGLQLQLDAQRRTESIEWFSPSYKIEHQDGIGSLLVEWPLRFRDSGNVRLPKMHLTYFDPEGGKLKRVVIGEQVLWVLPFWAWVVIDIAAGLFLAILLGLLLLGLNILWRMQQFRYRIGAADSLNTLWAVLQTWPCQVMNQRGGCSNLSLLRWVSQVQQMAGKSEALEQLNAALNRAFYASDAEANETVKVETLRKQALFWISRLSFRSLLARRVSGAIRQLFALKGLIKRRYF
ncbi:hypothetical protein [Thiomicrorhabdus sp.]|uniref:hypothetical protein n=1 Tax=Thiomicrorhabdus sp. TaxID=2039724 RepID=UPI0029C7A9BD|nr:hypothetical protein [Thiomicrorhabdus sp.]